MRTSKVFLALVILAVILGLAASSQAVSTKLYVQGRLTTAAGPYLPAGAYPMIFNIYRYKTDTAPLWSDTFPEIKVGGQGAFAVTLGSKTPLALGILYPDKPGLTTRVSVFAPESRWLEVVVNGEVFGRVKINTSGYAANADTLDGIDSYKFSQTDHKHSLDKLDGMLLDTQIPANITRDMEVMTIVTAAGGPGSGLHADLLDRKHAADLITAVLTPAGSGLSGGGGIR